MPKVRIPANIDEPLFRETDECLVMFEQLHGVKINRTAYIVKALKNLNSQVQDDYRRSEIKMSRGDQIEASR